MDITNTNSMLVQTIADIGMFLLTYLPYVISILAGLIGLGYLMRTVKNLIAGRPWNY